MDHGGKIVGQSLKNTANIVADNPLKATGAGLAVIGGAAMCSTGVSCPLGAMSIAYGIDQTHALANGNNMTTSQQ